MRADSSTTFLNVCQSIIGIGLSFFHHSVDCWQKIHLKLQSEAASISTARGATPGRLSHGLISQRSLYFRCLSFFGQGCAHDSLKACQTELSFRTSRTSKIVMCSGNSRVLLSGYLSLRFLLRAVPSQPSRST